MGPMTKYESKGCSAGEQTAYWNDKCYSYEQCETYCGSHAACMMFQTNGCHCIFYDSITTPWSAAGNWKCGIKEPPRPMTKYESKGCSAGQPTAYWNDKCYTYEQCETFCGSHTACMMFQT